MWERKYLNATLDRVLDSPEKLATEEKQYFTTDREQMKIPHALFSQGKSFKQADLHWDTALKHSERVQDENNDNTTMKSI